TQSFKTSSHKVIYPSQMESRLSHFHISGIGSYDSRNATFHSSMISDRLRPSTQTPSYSGACW
ncbi:hypothetical protein, partial [Nostoc sp.]|uniref:hypothetical protein n=1 Tax=Nostoc sp. TaxID=1180 RepID=UPI002FF5B04E